MAGSEHVVTASAYHFVRQWCGKLKAVEGSSVMADANEA